MKNEINFTMKLVKFFRACLNFYHKSLYYFFYPYKFCTGGLNRYKKYKGLTVFWG